MRREASPIHRVRRGTPTLVAPTLLTALLAASSPALAQDRYPSRPITLVAPFGAGSGTDIGARLLAKELGELLGQPVVVDNRPGANGAIGTQLVARAKPDGYTLMYGSATTHAANYVFFPTRLGYEPGDFEVVAGLGSTPQVLWVAETETARTLAELFGNAKARGRGLSCGSGNAVTQVACELLKKHSGADLATVSYKSNAQAIADIAAGQITMAFSDATAALPYVEQRRVRAFAVAAGARSAIAPDAPTFREQGYADFEITAWGAIFAPAHTPEPILQRLNVAITKANASPASVDMRRRSGSTDMPLPLEPMRRFVAGEVDKWRRYVQQSGVKAE
jgi:tripartite-type tricarboxylate transporter receptor subunit TctC